MTFRSRGPVAPLFLQMEIKALLTTGAVWTRLGRSLRSPMLRKSAWIIHPLRLALRPIKKLPSLCFLPECKKLPKSRKYKQNQKQTKVPTYLDLKILQDALRFQGNKITTLKWNVHLYPSCSFKHTHYSVYKAPIGNVCMSLHYPPYPCIPSLNFPCSIVWMYPFELVRISGQGGISQLGDPEQLSALNIICYLIFYLNVWIQT